MKLPASLSRLAASPTARTIAIVLLAGILLGLVGPFGSYLNGGPPIRVAYWAGAMLLGLPPNAAALAIAKRLPPAFFWPALAAGALLAAVPEAILTRAVSLRLWPSLAHVGPGWIVWYVQTTGICAAFLLAATWATRARPTPVPAAPLQPFAGPVLALQMEDHYVRIHTPQGSRLVLMPLAKAIASVQAEGMQTHRSWWVARAAIAAIDGTPRGMRLHLTNGIIAPVARSAILPLRQAGWLAAYGLAGSNSAGRSPQQSM